MNLLFILWMVLIVFWIINRANNITNTNTTTRKTTVSNMNKPSKPNLTNTTGSTRSNNIYATENRDTVSDEINPSTVDSVDNVKTLYESGIISKEEYREYKQRVR